MTSAGDKPSRKAEGTAGLPLEDVAGLAGRVLIGCCPGMATLVVTAMLAKVVAEIASNGDWG